MKRLISLLIFCFVPLSFAQDKAEALFKQLNPSVYQIKIIDIASGEKSSIGSGFQISADGIVATNYHVISSFARYPEKYRMRYIDHLGQEGDLSLERVDVVNDLALVKRAISELIPFFTIAAQAPIKGEELFSLGNPHDLGMIVVPGTYNGLQADSFNDRIHFTGSVNQGMSGGPVVNKKAQVVGINVATSGNQIGFLVPHDKLLTLYDAYLTQPHSEIKTQMAMQLTNFQNALLTDLLSAPWQLKTLDQANVPVIDVPYIRCWGSSNTDKKEDPYFTALTSCTLEDDIFIEGNFFTGTVEMHTRFMEKKLLSEQKFYQLYQQKIQRVNSTTKVDKRHIGEYQCHHDIVKNSTQLITNKAVLCSRAYKDFNNLFDVIYLSASVDKSDKALISLILLSGVNQDNALKFTRKFMESLSWQQ